MLFRSEHSRGSVGFREKCPQRTSFFGEKGDIPVVDLLAVANKTAPGRPFIRVTTPPGETLLRTPEAQLVTRPAAPAQDETDPIEWLTLKPEDAWDLLNVADQHQDLVETLRGFGA